MSWLKKLLGQSKQKRTLLDSVRETGGKLIVNRFRELSELSGGKLAPTSATSDEEIFKVYETVATAFNRGAEVRGAHIPAGSINTIVLKFLQMIEGDYSSEFIAEHLEYEVTKYVKEGLREDYKQQIPLF
jgi:hypothetical protein